MESPLPLVRTWGDDSGRVVGADPQLLLTADPGVVLVVTDNGITWMDPATGRRVETVPWGERPGLGFDAKVAVDRKGETLLVGTHQGAVVLYRTTDGARVRELGRSRGAVTDAALSADGAVAVAASSDGRVRAWRAATGELLREARGRGPVSVSPDGATVTWWRPGAAGGVFLGGVEGGPERRVPCGLAARRACWAPGGERLWVTGDVGGAECWSVAGPAREAAVARLPSCPVAACDRAGNLVLLDLRGEVLRVTPGGDVTALAAAADDRFLHAAVAPDGDRAAWLRHGSTLCIRDLATGREEHHHGEHAGTITAMALSPDGRLAATASNDRTVRVWEVASGRAVWSLEGAERSVSDVAFAPDGTRLYAACAEGAVRAWSLADGQELAAVACEGAATLRVSPDGGRAVATHAERRAPWLVDLARSRARRLEADGAFAFRAASFSPAGDEVWALAALDRASGRAWVFRYGAADGAVRSPSSPTVAAAMTELSRAWLTVPYDMQAAFSADGSAVASEGGNGAVVLWRAPSGERLGALGRAGRPRDLRPLAMAGPLLATPTRDGVELWEHASGRLVGEADLRPTGEHPVALALSPGGDALLVATSLGRVHHYAVPSRG